MNYPTFADWLASNARADTGLLLIIVLSVIAIGATLEIRLYWQAKYKLWIVLLNLIYAVTLLVGFGAVLIFQGLK